MIPRTIGYRDGRSNLVSRHRPPAKAQAEALLLRSRFSLCYMSRSNVLFSWSCSRPMLKGMARKPSAESRNRHFRNQGGRDRIAVTLSGRWDVPTVYGARAALYKLVEDPTLESAKHSVVDISAGDTAGHGRRYRGVGPARSAGPKYAR